MFSYFESWWNAYSYPSWYTVNLCLCLFLVDFPLPFLSFTLAFLFSFFHSSYFSFFFFSLPFFFFYLFFFSSHFNFFPIFWEAEFFPTQKAGYLQEYIPLITTSAAFKLLASYHASKCMCYLMHDSDGWDLLGHFVTIIDSSNQSCIETAGHVIATIYHPSLTYTCEE